MRTASPSACARGLERGDHFAVLMENNVHYPQLVGIAARGHDDGADLHRLTAPEISYIFKDAGAKFLLTSTHYAEAIAASATNVRTCRC